MDEREQAWFALHDALPKGWRVGPLSFDPAASLYEVAAWSPLRGRRKGPEHVLVGRGVDELTAVRSLSEMLRDLSRQ